MAKVFPPYPISGTVGGMTYFRKGNDTFVRSAIKGQKKSGKRDRQKENRRTFGGAQVAACKLYTLLTQKRKHSHLLRPYSHNDIARRLRETAERSERAVTHYTFRAAHAAFQGMDLSHEESPSARVKVTAIGSQHNPDSVRVAGLREAASAIGIHGNARLEMRVHLRYVQFTETKYSREAKSWSLASTQYKVAASPRSGWIPAEVLPEEGLLLKLDKHNQDFPMLAFLFIEWREIREVGQRIHPRHEMAVVRVAAMQYTEAMAQEIAQVNQQRKPKNTHTEPENLLQAAKADPKAFLARAMKGLAAIKSPPPDTR